MLQWFKIQQIDPEQFQQIFNKFAMIFKKTTFMLIKCDSKRTLVKIGKSQIFYVFGSVQNDKLSWPKHI